MRNAIAFACQIPRENILPATRLEDLIPVRRRQSIVKKINTLLGLRLINLSITDRLALTWLITTVCSLTLFFISWKLAVSCLLINFSAIWLSVKMAKLFQMETVGALARHFAWHNYRTARRDPASYNPREVTPFLINAFTSHFDIDPKTLTADTRL
ncbi:hypothetical protein [Flavihumibacter petaseus]|uniref:Uncharacterized protein n=1 Tax=Flavihumibacter petaseus NBRC 106054 TaxID=1220578 RepID=A0A0E9N0P3_9BACT|nr:hypothetical protein [Flavihumibacter petaseus]GAO43577.1 hypothetical protein FPE01S_02_06830 [Flavihumibacter petaseus NBRC 106054]